MAAPDTWFFLSYARFDRDDDRRECIRTFYADLDERIRLKKVIKAGSAGFYDGTGIQQGDAWPSTLVEALSACRAMICMYSPAYFASEYCGRELEIFTRRLIEYAKGSKAVGDWPPLIIPIMLDPPQDLKPLPDAITDIQMFDDLYPEVYREEGLRYLFRRSDPKLKDVYEDLLDAVVDKLVNATAAHPLAALANLPDIKQTESLFHPRLKQAVVSTQTTISAQATNATGPAYAEFIYVAGKRSEVEALGRKGDNYGDVGGLDWKPYLPGVSDEVAFLAQAVAGKEKFRYLHAPLGTDIVSLIRNAQENNIVVIIIVDTWTIRLKEYHDLMRAYDSSSFWNCAVLIAWNNMDEDTVRERGSLEKAIRLAFVNKVRSKDEDYFISDIGTYDDLVKNLSIALQKVKLQVIDVTKDIKTIEGDVITQPTIAGPGASTRGN